MVPILRHLNLIPGVSLDILFPLLKKPPIKQILPIILKANVHLEEQQVPMELEMLENLAIVLVSELVLLD